MRDALLTVLRDTRLLLARPENDFTWSSWENAEAALREIDALIAIVSKGAWPDRRQLPGTVRADGTDSGDQRQQWLERDVSRTSRAA